MANFEKLEHFPAILGDGWGWITAKGSFFIVKQAGEFSLSYKHTPSAPVKYLGDGMTTFEEAKRLADKIWKELE